MQEKNKEVLYTPGAKIESPTHPEQGQEQAQEQYEERRDQSQRSDSTDAERPSTAQQSAPPSPRTIDPELEGTETILASGLDTFFMGLSPDEQLRFKAEGESAAQKIQKLLHKPATKIKEIVAVIIGWLKRLPGINKYFLEQEAKIKADTIMRKYRS